MEFIAIPGVVAAALAFSNKDNKKKKKSGVESYANMNANMTELNPPTRFTSFPVDDGKIKDTQTPYINPNDATAKYFDQNRYVNHHLSGMDVGNQIGQVHSLTGGAIDQSNFKHNNMTPFYGSKVTQVASNKNYSESRLDNMVGAGSTTFRKQETAPLFKPQENIQHSHGQPNMNDFFQSRAVPGMSQNNTKPFESVQVGPGVGEGYTKNGTGGFNSGLNAREHYMPRNVDQLRTTTNPKMEYSLNNHQGPAKSQIINRGLMGKMENRKPNTFYEQTSDRWLTTNSEVKATTSRPTQEVPLTMRMQSQSYQGIAGPGNEQSNYAQRNYEESTKQGLPGLPVMNLKGDDAGFNTSGIQRSYDTTTNNRAIDCKSNPTYGSGFASAIGAVIAPFTDILNPTKKQEVIENMRVYGNPESTVEAPVLMDNKDMLPVTVKETTLHTPHTYMQMQGSDAYLVTEPKLPENNRQTTSQYVVGGAGGTGKNYGVRDHDMIQSTNETKELSFKSRANHGNMQVFTGNVNVSTAKQDSDRDNNRMWAPSSMPSKTMSKETYGKMVEPVHNQQNVVMERMEPDILNAFKNNPYTQSLSSASLR